jgi:hypothetical protein
MVWRYGQECSMQRRTVLQILKMSYFNVFSQDFAGLLLVLNYLPVIFSLFIFQPFNLNFN